MSKQDNLTDFLTDIADTIRANNTGASGELLNPQKFTNYMKLEDQILYTENADQTYVCTATDGWYGLKSVTIKTPAINAKDIRKGSNVMAIDGTYNGVSSYTLCGGDSFTVPGTYARVTIPTDSASMNRVDLATPSGDYNCVRERENETYLHIIIDNGLVLCIITDTSGNPYEADQYHPAFFTLKGSTVTISLNAEDHTSSNSTTILYYDHKVN